jgi:hypothetical protein
MGFGTFNTTRFNKTFMAGVLWMSASGVVASSTEAHYNVYRYVDSPAVAESFTEGTFRIIGGFRYGTRVGTAPFNATVLNEGDFVSNAVFITGLDANAVAQSEDAGLRLAKAEAVSTGASVSQGTLRRKAGAASRTNAVARAFDEADGVYAIPTNLVYVTSWGLARATSRGLANGPVGYGSLAAEGFAAGHASRIKKFTGSSVASVVSVTDPSRIMGYKAGATATATLFANPTSVVGGTRYSYLSDALETATSLSGDPTRLAKTGKAVVAAAQLTGTLHRGRYLDGIEAVGTATAAPLPVYRRHPAFVSLVATANTTGLSVRRVRPGANTNAEATSSDVALRLGVSTGTGFITSEATGNAIRLGKGTSAAVAQGGASGEALRLGKAFGSMLVEGNASPVFSLRYAKAFGDAEAHAESKDFGTRVANSIASSTALAKAEDTAVRLGISSGSATGSTALEDKATRLSKPYGNAYAEGHLPPTVTTRYGNAFAHSAAQGSVTDVGVRLAKVSSSLTTEALATGASIRLAKAASKSAYGYASAFDTASKIVRFNLPVPYSTEQFIGDSPINSQGLFSRGYRRTMSCYATSVAYPRLNLTMGGTEGRIYTVPADVTKHTLFFDDRSYVI